MKIREKHSLILRLTHWLNVPLLALMIWSGILIYWAHGIYPGFFPQWFYSAFSVNNRLAEGLAIHFFIGWFFVFNGLIYLIWFFLSGHWREILPHRAAWKDFGFRRQNFPPAKFNAVQRLIYTGVIGLGILGVLSGFALYKPVQLGWLCAAFGGYQAARFVHFAVMILLSVFIFIHVVQVLRAGWNNLRSMVAGFEEEK